MRRDAGPSNALHYVEQTSWILFLKYLEDTEKVNADAAELAGKEYIFAIDQRYRWSKWAVPTKDDGSIDHDKKLQGEDLIDFVNNDLFKFISNHCEINLQTHYL